VLPAGRRVLRDASDLICATTNIVMAVGFVLGSYPSR
jgi:hypothetical protein